MTAARTWTGRILTGLVTASLLFDGALKVVAPGFAASHSVELGFPADLLTGFLGGAIATHVRVGNPLLGYTLFPVYVAALAWAGLLLRDSRLRVLVPSTRRV